MKFRILTYNMHKAIGGIDRKYRPERVVQAIAEHDADVVLLQEVDEGAPRSEHHRQVDLLGDALEYPYRAFQPNVKLRQGHYGNAVLSRFPFQGVHHLELTIRFKKRRRALVVLCQLSDNPNHTLLIYNLHLGLAGLERSIQLRRLLACPFLNEREEESPAIIAGDFNDLWGKLGKRLLEPEHFRPAKQLKTFPAIYPLRPLDRIYYRGNLRLLNSYVCSADISRQASDHLPLIAEMELA